MNEKWKLDRIKELNHLDIAEDFSKALRKWIQYRLDENIPSRNIELEIEQTTKNIIGHILNPMCKPEEKKCLICNAKRKDCVC